VTAASVAAPFLGRRTSPPPEDWKPLDKCYFCLDGKLPHDDQPPLVSILRARRYGGCARLRRPRRRSLQRSFEEIHLRKRRHAQRHVRRNK
jgi:hypothetical protein